MIDAKQLLRFVIRPTLTMLASYTDLPLASPAAERLLLATAATESHGGRYLHQIGGPAQGIYQIEPATAVETMRQLRKRHYAFRVALEDIRPAAARDYPIESDLAYATALARAYYWLDPAPLPAADDLNGIWLYYKRRWNTELGKATRDRFDGDIAMVGYHHPDIWA